MVWKGRLRPKREEEKRKERRERTESDHGGLDHHLIITEQCPYSGRVPEQRDNVNIYQIYVYIKVPPKIQHNIQRKFQPLIIFVVVDCWNRLRIDFYVDPRFIPLTKRRSRQELKNVVEDYQKGCKNSNTRVEEGKKVQHAARTKRHEEEEGTENKSGRGR